MREKGLVSRLREALFLLCTGGYKSDEPFGCDLMTIPNAQRPGVNHSFGSHNVFTALLKRDLFAPHLLRTKRKGKR
jgi:hypothetical protein